MKVEHYGANAVEVDGVLVSYETPVARVGRDGSFHRLWSGSVKQNRREKCRRNYHLAVSGGCFLVARKYLRNALIWSSPTARARSREWCYDLRGGKLHAFEYKCSY